MTQHDTQAPAPAFGATPQPAWAKVVGLGAAVVALLGVWWLYTRPDFLVNLADQLWACF